MPIRELAALSIHDEKENNPKRQKSPTESGPLGSSWIKQEKEQTRSTFLGEVAYNIASNTKGLVEELNKQSSHATLEEHAWKPGKKELEDVFREHESKLQQIPRIEIPAALKAELFPHQKEGLKWLAHQDQTGEVPPFFVRNTRGVWRCRITGKFIDDPKPIRGGILADDMGLGKSIQTISLILACPPAGQTEYPFIRSKSDCETPRCTLIVCPVSVIASWMDQFEKFVNKGKKKVLKIDVYQGTKRNKVLQKVWNNDLDVLLVSYHTMASDHKKKEKEEAEAAERKKEMEVNDEKDDEEKIEVTVIDSDVDDDSTGVAVDNIAAMGRSRRKGRNVQYADSDTGSDNEEWSENVADDNDDDSLDDDSFYEDESTYMNDDDGPLYLSDVSFHRIVLDEAHFVRNVNTGLFKSANAIHAERKICLTGTPFVNHPKDIQALLAFLCVSPLDDPKAFTEAITVPIAEKKAIGLKRLRAVTSSFALRRTKHVLETAISLPAKSVQVVSVPFPDDSYHKMVHDAVYTVSRMVISAFLREASGGQLGGLFGCLMQLLLRNRQSCCNAGLVPSDVRQRTIQAFDLVKDSQELELGEAQMILKKIVTTSRRNDAEPESTGPDVDNDMEMAPKVQAFLDCIPKMNADEKAVVFSQWTSHLDKIQQALEAKGHRFARIDGSMNAFARTESMRGFESDHSSSPRFMLCSLHACGTGITLVRANWVFMFDPWWNKAVESQASDRVFRIGQTREVSVVRFVMKDSIEERMVALQDAKAALGKGSLEKLSLEEQNLARLTALRELFKISEEEDDWDEFIDDHDEAEWKPHGKG